MAYTRAKRRDNQAAMREERVAQAEASLIGEYEDEIDGKRVMVKQYSAYRARGIWANPTAGRSSAGRYGEA